METSLGRKEKEREREEKNASVSPSPTTGHPPQGGKERKRFDRQTAGAGVKMEISWPHHTRVCSVYTPG